MAKKRLNLLATVLINLIADCLSKKVFYNAMNSELTVSRFTEIHAAHTIVQACCLELEAELSKLLDKVQKDDHAELVKHFSNLENATVGRDYYCCLGDVNAAKSIVNDGVCAAIGCMLILLGFETVNAIKEHKKVSDNQLQAEL
ncbi:hypothetical protein Tco_0425385 [Tanacetum coccineum]